MFSPACFAIVPFWFGSFFPLFFPFWSERRGDVSPNTKMSGLPAHSNKKTMTTKKLKQDTIEIQNHLWAAKVTRVVRGGRRGYSPIKNVEQPSHYKSLGTDSPQTAYQTSWESFLQPIHQRVCHSKRVN